MSYQSSMIQKGVAAGAWLDTTSAAAKARLSLMEKAPAEKEKTPLN